MPLEDPRVHRERNRRYYRQLWRRMRRSRGSRCRACPSREKLEMAHRRPTGLMGEGRGQHKRIIDVRRNPRAYVLLCKLCHLFFDRGILLRANRSQGWRCRLLSPEEREVAFVRERAKMGEEEDFLPLEEIRTRTTADAVEAGYRSEAREIFRRETWPER